ncbi:MAG: hypothetical protein ABIQ74_08980 [Chitinophagales bacterium]
MRFFFGIQSWRDLYTVMSVTFLCLLPSGAGALTIYFSSIRNVESFAYRFFMPWIPIFAFFIITVAIAIEGWACWIMVLPVFLLAASIGGLIAGYLRLRKYKSAQRLHVSVILLLPLILSPLEQLIKIVPGKFEAYTSIVIHSSKEKIWSNVTRVREIEPGQNKAGFAQFMEFPQPIKAELNYEGVGATREAIFSHGLIFHEKVWEYQKEKKMMFSITAYPYEIPSTTMDEHITIGGNYFDVLDGAYELEEIYPSIYRLHLSSHFTLSTTFNFYASWWARWIMKDIQNNILQLIKVRAESK